jgi:hypothetical protein
MWEFHLGVKNHNPGLKKPNSRLRFLDLSVEYPYLALVLMNDSLHLHENVDSIIFYTPFSIITYTCSVIFPRIQNKRAWCAYDQFFFFFWLNRDRLLTLMLKGLQHFQQYFANYDVACHYNLSLLSQVLSNVFSNG